MVKSDFKLTRVSGSPVTDAEILADLKRVAGLAGSPKVSQAIYVRFGKFDVRNIARRFGTWNQALQAAGLAISNEVNVPDERLFENIFVLWQHYGRQPRQAELSRPPSALSQGPYRRRFRTWMGALEAFVEYANATDTVTLSPSTGEAPPRTTRFPSLRLRFRVLQRDRFACQRCGAAPATKAGVELHVDHILPWSKGGETVIENLITLCARCNLGKGNLLPETV